MAGYWRFVAVVEGEGTFPLDMLRYDRCTPYGQQDVDNMGSRLEQGRRQVEVVKFHPSKHIEPFTTGRWESFGWRIVRQHVPVNVA